MRANEAAAAGDLAAVERTLADYNTDTPLGRTVVVQRYRLQQRWPELLTFYLCCHRRLLILGVTQRIWRCWLLICAPDKSAI